jgi:PhzF family phenazine biosynthesis protein
VCFLPEWLPDSLLQAIAAENGLPETAFVVQKSDHFLLRWFTPNLEMDLCGHATLAPAYVLFQHYGYPKDKIAFETRSGILTVRRKADYFELDFPSRPAVACSAPASLLEGLGITEALFIGKARDYLVVLPDEKSVAELNPNFQELKKIDTLGIITTAPGKQVDFVSRFFAPRAGVDEDPVTGSAHSTLIPYWSTRLGKTVLKARQISARGGELFCELRGERVGIGGRATTYMQGFMNIDVFQGQK